MVEGKIRGRMKEWGSMFFLVQVFFLLVGIWTTRLVIVEFHYTNDLAE
jgi:hypothetical protein